MFKKISQVLTLIVKSMAEAGKLESQAYYIASKGYRRD